MAHFQEIPENLKAFIEQQKIFYVATATADSRLNLSPKGMDSFRVLDENRVIWLNVTGSGNETSAHVQESPRNESIPLGERLMRLSAVAVAT